jgi:hypothetical protein
MEILEEQLKNLVDELENSADLKAKLEQLISDIYPFNKFEFTISHLLVAGKLTLEDYYQMRQNYIDRNLNLYLFEISAPRGFGELWAQSFLKQIVPNLQRPSKTLHTEYQGGEYDFFLSPNIRIEVKASRAVDAKSNLPLYQKALSSDSNKPFVMNFQQVKPKYCDVFVWIAVWRDTMKIWVIPSYEVENNRFYSKGQHRGNIGEGQLHIKHDNIKFFDKYLTEPSKIEEAIRKAFKKEKKLRNK